MENHGKCWNASVLVRSWLEWSESRIWHGWKSNNEAVNSTAIFIFNIHPSDWQVSGTSFYHLEARGLRVVGKEWGCVFFCSCFLKRPVRSFPKMTMHTKRRWKSPWGAQHPWGSLVFFWGGFCAAESPWVPRPQWQAAAGTKASRNWLAACWWQGQWGGSGDDSGFVHFLRRFDLEEEPPLPLRLLLPSSSS